MTSRMLGVGGGVDLGVTWCDKGGEGGRSKCDVTYFP